MTDQLSADEAGGDGAPDGPIGGGPEADGSTTVTIPHAGTGRTRGPFRRFGRGQRVSRWDRPPEPHDWRFYVGMFGRVLIVTGLLMFGFVAYQLWGTGIETARAQNRLEDRFATMLAEAAPTSEVNDPSSDSVAPTTTAPTAPEITTGEITPAVPIAVDLSDQAVEQDPIPQPFRGEPLLRLEIPEIGRDDIVVPGVTVNDLKDGPGHYPDTPLPGQLGNAAIAGHRTTYGGPFFDVDQLEPGDEIITTLLNGDRFVYEVTFIEVVSASDYGVVTTRDPDIAELTLTSCHPKYTARERIIVHSVLDPDQSSNVGFPTFYTLEGDDPADAIAGDDPVLSADIEVTEPDSALGDLDEPSDDVTAEPDREIDNEVSGGADVGNDVGSNPPAAGADDAGADDEPRVGVTDDSIDGFGQGWFDDRDAFPQIALWAGALVIIALLAYQVAKRFRRHSLGFLVGVAPFVVALYFFYQNVNRLLPPGL